jgi:ATP-binding cassette, subfamily C, bacterial
MTEIFKIFFGSEKTKPLLVMLCLIFASLSEAIGITTLLPAGAAILGEAGGQPNLATRLITQAFAVIHLSPTFGNFLLIAVLLLFLKALLSFIAIAYTGITGARVTTNLRRRLVNALFNARWSYYAESSSGELANAISSDAARAGDAYGLSAATISYLLQFMTYAVAALFIDWQVAFAAAGAGALLMLISNVLVRKTRAAGAQLYQRQALFTSSTVDILNNIKPLKSMNRYGALLETLSGQLRRLRNSMIRLHIAQEGLSYGIDFLLAAIVGSGAYFMHTYWNKSLNDMMVTGIIFFQLISSLTRFQKQRNRAIQLEGAYARITKLIDHAEAAAEPHYGTLTPDFGTGCTFKNVSFAHAKKPTVENLNFDIPANKVTVFQGQSGAGKTTIIDLLIGLHQPQSGEIIIGQQPLTKIDVKQWRDQIGYVPQELMLFHASIKDNICLSDPAITDAQVMAALVKAGAKSFINAMPEGIDTDVGEMGSKLSGGQRQRISLARALVKNPKILILDEVTSALDPETEREIVQNISALQNEYTIIAITHRPAWTSIADRLYNVQNGTLKRAKGKST